MPDASTLTITPFDKGSIKDIEKALNESDIGINPNNDGQKIRLVIPPMTQVGGRGAAGRSLLFAPLCGGAAAGR